MKVWSAVFDAWIDVCDILVLGVIDGVDQGESLNGFGQTVYDLLMAGF